MMIRYITGLATALALALTTVGLVAPEPATATAAPAAETPSTEGGLPPITPVPQDVSLTGQSVPLTNKALVVRTDATDPAAVEAVVAALRDAGVRDVRESQSPDPGNNGTFVVLVGGPQENPASEQALARLAPESQGPTGLASGGYVLASVFHTVGERRCDGGF